MWIWGGRFQKTFYDVRIFNPNAPSYKSSAISSCYKLHEQEKKHCYEESVKRMWKGLFYFLVFSCTGGASTLTSTLLKRLGSLLSLKQNIVYSTSINWIRCRIGFALLRASIRCLRGCRTRTPINKDILLASAESRLPCSS